MRYYNYVLFLFLINVLLNCSCSRSITTYVGEKLEKSPKIDGFIDEWQSPFPKPSSQIGIGLRTAYDNKFLYLAVQVSDNYYQSLILTQGASIFLDTLAKRNNRFGIGYPIALNAKTLEDIANESQGDERLFLDNYAKAHQEFDLIGVVEEPIRASNLTSKDIKVAASFDELKNLVFELKIPLQQVFNKIPTSNTVFSVGIKINEKKTSPLDEEDDRSLFNNRTTQNNSMTGRNPLMSPNGGNRSQNIPSNTRSKSPSVWSRIQLGN